MEQDLLEILDSAIKERSVITIERPELPEPELLCIPISRSDELILVHAFYDFHPDGYRIVRVDDVYAIFREGSELFFERIFKGEGVYSRLKTPQGIDLTSWKEVLESLKGRYQYCIVECEAEEEFLIGKVMEISDWEFTFWYFDAAGKWDEELDVVDYDELTSVGFDDCYTNTIVKYIENP